jgi:hypothetical protein
MRRLAKEKIEARLAHVLFQNNSWGAVERLGGITDRNAWWHGKTEAQARDELRRLIRERIVNGDF